MTIREASRERSDRPRNRPRDHPLPPFPETTRVIVRRSQKAADVKGEKEKMRPFEKARAVELGVLYLTSLGVCRGFTPSTRVVSRREGGGWSHFRF